MDPGAELHPWLRFHAEAATRELAERLRSTVVRDLRRKGVVIAVSGGIDSAVCAALAARAFPPEQVLALSLPERESSPSGTRLGGALARQLGIPLVTEDLTAALDAVGCYARRDAAIRAVIPEFEQGWRSKIVAAASGAPKGRFTWFRLVVESPSGERRERRLPLKEYLEIVAATSFKQRMRKTMEYFHADRLRFAVAGTPNRLEYDQGFFVRNGDGSADVKPIAHLYKSQVYALGRACGLPAEILAATPTTDTYTLEQGQDEFFFRLPYPALDLVLCGLNLGRTRDEIAAATGLEPGRVASAIQEIQDRRSATAPLHRPPILLEGVPEIASGRQD